MKCAECKWWKRPKDNPVSDHGTCKWMPLPVKTHQDDYCGQFQLPKYSGYIDSKDLFNSAVSLMKLVFEQEKELEHQHERYINMWHEQIENRVKLEVRIQELESGEFSEKEKAQ